MDVAAGTDALLMLMNVMMIDYIIFTKFNLKFEMKTLIRFLIRISLSFILLDAILPKNHPEFRLGDSAIELKYRNHCAIYAHAF